MQKKTSKEKIWLSKVAKVFDTRPRDASNPENLVWLPRDEQEKEILDILYLPGVHLCLDGPTGTGKSSLALTALGNAEIRYVPIQVTTNMTWEEFCRNLVSKPASETESSVSADFEVGIQTGLPIGKFQVSLGHKKHENKSLDEIAKGWTEHDVCKAMVKEGVTLLIDDFEKASDEIVTRVADMAKLLTQSYASAKSKLAIVGTDDIYKHLYEKNPSLEGRLAEVSLGGFPNANHSWKYLLLGFEALKLRHPANSSFDNERAKLGTCIRAVYDAADGLPKGLTHLGWEITKNSSGRPAVTASDITSSSMRVLKTKVRRFKKQFPELLHELRHNESTRIVLRYLLEAGAGLIHPLDDVIAAVRETLSNRDAEGALEKLVKHDLLVQTGSNSDIVFFKDLSFAHTLSVVAENPQKYGLEPGEFTPLAQLRLPYIT
jgi:hypothetical protein